MKSQDAYYINSLYPFQDGILKLVNAAKTPFYLTGGTALGRFYFNHRYSDDLDFFVNQNDEFGIWVERLLQILDGDSPKRDFEIDRQRIKRVENYAQVFLRRHDELPLKVEFVNDVAPHFGTFEHYEIGGRVDSLQNILSNKISALGRLEIKDFVDVWMIARRIGFNWKDIIEEARQKDAGVEPLLVCELVKTVPVDMLQYIRWTGAVDYRSFQTEMERMSFDILQGGNN